jgi:hypothetical protein
MMFTCPGIARPSVNKKNKIFPEIVTDLAIAYAAMLASRSVNNTEDIETITLFLKGVIKPPESNNVRKLSKVHLFGKANGVE